MNNSYDSDSRNSRVGRLALGYKLCVKKLLDCAESRLGRPLDPVLREAVMVEMQIFFHTAKELIGDENPAYEEFYHRVVDECQSLARSKTASGD